MGGPFFDGTNNLYTSISWGVSETALGPFDGKSGLSINVNPPPAGSADPALVGNNPTTLKINGVNTFPADSTSSAPQELGNLTHWNYVITEPFPDGKVDFRYYLDLYTDAARTSLLASLHGDFRVHVNETPNVDGGPCPAGNPQGTFCDDIFTYEELVPFSSTPFSYAGSTYVVAVSGFYPTRDFAGSTAGAFYSGEGSNNTGFVAELKEVPPSVPEPGTLTLIGAGLLGAAAIRRRSKAA